MSSKIRIYELSKTLGRTNQEVIDALEVQFKLTVKSSSSIESDVAKKLEAHFKTASKPAEKVTSEPVSKTAPKTAAKAEPKAETPKAKPVEKAEPVKAEAKPALAPKAPVGKPETVTKAAPALSEAQPISQSVLKPKPEASASVQMSPEPQVAKPASSVAVAEVFAPETEAAPVVTKKSRRNADDEEEEEKIVEIKVPMTLLELATILEKRETELIKHLFLKGIMVTVNQTLQVEDAIQLAEELDFVVIGPEKKKGFEEGTPQLQVKENKGKNLITRAPVVSIMGQVDHGKTSLLDAIRETRHKIVDTEAGGITQKIGAYTVYKDDQKIVFVDTPGHEAFTAMRLRGAKSTDIAIIVVAADDGVMPQTVEAINHARMANVPIIIGINKIDKDNADPERVLGELAEHGITVEKWGGDTLSVELSATQKLGLDDLLEMIVLVADLQQLKADPSLEGEGVVVESWLDKGKGAVATVLVQSGTLRVGDNIILGSKGGRVRALISDSGERLKEAGPSTPVEILGLNAVPEAGEMFRAFHDDKEFKKTLMQAQIDEKENKFARSAIPGLYTEGEHGRKDFYVIVKADTQGSVEAISSSILRLATDEIPVHVIHAATGDVTEGDILLASANNALIVCFNSGVETTAARSAQAGKIVIKHFDVIYHLAEEIEKLMLGMLSPDREEIQIGMAEIRKIFTAGNTVIAGSYVQEGKVTRNAIARVFRGKEQVYDGIITQLKRFKDDAKEVATGFECGISFQKFNDLEEGDIVKVFEIQSFERTSLTAN